MILKCVCVGGGGGGGGGGGEQPPSYTYTLHTQECETAVSKGLLTGSQTEDVTGHKYQHMVLVDVIMLGHRHTVLRNSQMKYQMRIYWHTCLFMMCNLSKIGMDTTH